jgi:hypothetical protein
MAQTGTEKKKKNMREDCKASWKGLKHGILLKITVNVELHSRNMGHGLFKGAMCDESKVSAIHNMDN